MLEIIEETLLDSIKILPFLFITYLIMEYIEHKMKQKSKMAIKKSGKYGPLIGSLVGIFPQCGFSVSATNLYAGRVITLRNSNICLFDNLRRNATNNDFRSCFTYSYFENIRNQIINRNSCRIYN